MELDETETPKQSEIQRIVLEALQQAGIKSSRDFEEKTGISHAMYGRYLDMKSIMSLDKLEQIFSKYPVVQAMVSDYLSLNTEIKSEKATPAIITGEAAINDEVKEKMEETISILREENMKLLNIVELAVKRGGSDGA